MAESIFRFADEIGPSKIVHLYNPAVDLKAIVVVDNIAAGPAIGGTRMAPDVSVDECFRLARAMTLKNAAASLPHGGAKSVIFGDPAMKSADKEAHIRAFACEIRDLVEYIPGPDMGTNETSMAWIKDETGRSVGLPRELGGIPLDEIGATGFGLAIAAEAAEPFCDIELAGARVAIQGFGAVGKHAARFLTQRGAVLVAASDSSGAIHDPDGIDVADLIAFKESGGQIGDYEKGRKLGSDDIVGTACDIWIPAARPDVLRMDNVDRVDCKLVLQGANIPVTPEAEARLHERGILSLPDFIANAGGVICASVEYRGGTEADALRTIEEKIRRNANEVLERARDDNSTPRRAAVELATERVRKAMHLRRWHSQ
ncbi:Glu/Leu/Phe/Val dehydrogenase [Rhizobiales bacterium]|uniref:Glu/Leu/Phe/Val family dehydrogenase n=1 Tax=Hongsoonwoonella zoysiae TaxID=2821844 RepID=UPI001561007D|nr:Glu/Leu/Phe/Val dehydrogenase [Hongsoonwoonella zoysiae]NRG18731.1 Glu/Leu/Phe/Val dehydrogenase [Hongsoonwoonella zoysiae]